MKVFLDDLRWPQDVPPYTNFSVEDYEDNIVVRNGKEFQELIDKHLDEITFISFDHDLADEHYVPQEYWNDFEKSKEYQEQQFYKELTGKDCADYLCHKLDGKPFNIKVNIHSMNPAGALNIQSVLFSYIKIFGGDKNLIKTYIK